MKQRILLAAIFAAGLLRADEGTQRAIQLPDILAWKHIQTPLVSNDGGWFAYKLAPGEGNAEVVIRNLKDGKEQRFSIGELPRPEGNGPPIVAPPRDLAISDDGKWAAFLVYPSAKEAKALRKQKKPLQNKLMLVELATGDKKEFDKIRRFAFSGERSTAIAMHRYAPAPATPPGPAPAAPPAQGAVAGRENEDRVQGSDLIVYELKNGLEMNVGNVSDFAFDKKGDWLAWLIDAQDKEGNGIQVRNMATGSVMGLDSGKAVYKGLTWTEKGDGLATVRGIEDKAWEEKLYTLVAFRNFSGGTPEKVVFDPAKDKSFPEGMTISPNRNPYWMQDLSAVAFGIHEVRAKKKDEKKDDGDDSASARPSRNNSDDEPDKPDMVIWNWKDKRLPPMQQVQETQDRNFSFLSLYRPAEQKFLRLADEELRQVTATADYKYAMGIDIRNYELESNLDGKRFEDVYAVNLRTGERKLAVKQARWVQGPSPDGTHVLYYDDGAFFTFDLTTGQSYNITKQIPAVFIDTEDDHNVVKPPHRPIGWAKDSSAVLLSDGWDIWKAPVHGGTGVNLTGNGKADKIRYRVRYRLDPDEKGIDLAAPIYVGAYGEWSKKGGVGVIAPGQAGIQMLHWDDAHYQTMVKAKHADVYLYTRETTQDFPNFYIASAKLESGQRVTDANPQQKDFLWSKGVKIVDYTSDKGDKLQGALYLPANYQAGKTYPTIVYIYEKLSQGANTYSIPSFNGFNTAVYTSNGYAVLTPDIVYKVNDPGMSAVWCILPGLKAAVATGVVDAKRVALHGHSWGGYQTAFMVTQSNAFHAAIAGAPLTDMIAMYNAIYWNTGTTNQPIFESSQGRFYGGPWDNLESYQRNSPVYHAKNVTTPLIILHNDKDGAVDWTQGIEYYNTLRRQGKQVVMLQYKGENHGLRKPENMKDYTVRMKEFFDYELMDRQPPKWWTEGVPLLKMKDHIDERVKQMTKAPVPATGGGQQ
jgi:dipeptidyl aminopeptidase/acylaminoacyl peptidase